MSMFVWVSMWTGTGEDKVQHKLLVKVEAHKRIIWTCSWSSCDHFFATGSRDKTVKIWELLQNTEDSFQVRLNTTLPVFKSSVTALAWAPYTASLEKSFILAVGKEDGSLELWKANLTLENPSLSHQQGIMRKLEMNCCSRLDTYLCHAATIHRLCWRKKPAFVKGDDHAAVVPNDKQMLQLASCGADHTIRMFNVNF